MAIVIPFNDLDVLRAAPLATGNTAIAGVRLAELIGDSLPQRHAGGREADLALTRNRGARQRLLIGWPTVRATMVAASCFIVAEPHVL